MFSNLCAPNFASGLFRIPLLGGETQPVTSPEQARRESLHLYSVLPAEFLIGTMVGEVNAPPVSVILNWMAELKQ